MERRYKDSQNIDRISFARVVRVNYKYNTVDVVADKGGFSSAEEGRYAAKLPMLFGGRNYSGYEYGQVNPISVGSLVLIGFVEGEKVSPVVIGAYNDNSEASEVARTRLISSGPLDKGLSKETLQQFSLHPSLTYENIDGKGNVFKTLPGMTFLTAEAGVNPLMGGPSDIENGTRYDELPDSYYRNGELIIPEELRAPRILFRHEGGRVDREDLTFKKDDHVFMWFLDEKGNHRKTTLREEDIWKSFYEMEAHGDIRLKHQKDTKSTNNSKEYNEVLVDKDGTEISTKRASLDREINFKLDEEGTAMTISSEGVEQKIEFKPSGMDSQIKDTQINISKEGLTILDEGGSRIHMGSSGIELSSGGTSLRITPEGLIVNNRGEGFSAIGGGTSGDLMIPEKRRAQMDNNTEEIARIWSAIRASQS